MAEYRDAPRLGWIGAGRMGSVLARRLLAAGHDVSVYNRTRSRADALADGGARVVAAPSDLAPADIVFVSVSSSQDVIDVLLGPAGLLSGTAAPAVVVDCSTISRDASAHIRRELASRGTQFLAAPIMGNPRVAQAGRVTFAVSGPRAAFSAVAPVLDQLGAGATYIGDGDGARIVKICHNIFLGIAAQSMAEVTVLAEKSGISRAAFLDCLNSSVMGSAFTRYKSPAMVNLDFSATFTGELLLKDLDLGLAEARREQVPLPVTALVRQIVQSLIGHGYGHEDFAALLELQAQSAGLELVSEDAEVPDGLGPDEPGFEDPGQGGQAAR
ncbi:MAG: NAD(P)-dependent oxidoreductase [Streptosporangiaceae bacterium]|jgi:3-hydroxyisobutyrate dehydrogenase-like beta-hydroxyacid dehydrogenase